MFMCGKHKHAVSRLRRLITIANEKTKDHYTQVCKPSNDRYQTSLLKFSAGAWEYVLEARGLRKCDADAFPCKDKDSFYLRRL